MKRILSIVLCAVMMLSLSVYANDSAVTEESNAQELKNYGIMLGDPDGNMRLQDELTRAEATVLLVRLYRFNSSEVAALHRFSDMVGHWACKEVDLAEKFRMEGADDVLQLLVDAEMWVPYVKGKVVTYSWKKAQNKLKAPDEEADKME